MGDRSPFRTGFLKVALFINGVWVDVPTTELGDDGVTIKRGRETESGGADPSSATLRLKDPTGKWSPRHPSSPYFGLIGRGTPLRVQVELTAGVVLDRFYGEVVRWQPRWTKKGAPSAYVEVEAAGVLRRIGQGSAPLRSPIYRGRSSIGTNLRAYWPLEDSSGAKSFGYYSGSNPMTISGAPNVATYTGIAGSEPLPTVESAMFTGKVPGYTGTAAQIRWLTRVPSTTPNDTVLMRINFTGGTLGRIEISYMTGGSLKTTGYDQDGTQVGTSTVAFAVNGKNMQWSVECTTSGANVTATMVVFEIGQGGTFSGTTLTGVTLGRVASVVVNPKKAALTDVVMGHITVERVITSVFDLADQLDGYTGERADDRLSRLCTENGIPFGYFNFDDLSQLMGPQQSKQLVDLLRECVETDGGILFEPRNTDGLGYRTLESLYSQTPVTIPYTDNLLMPFEPKEDDDSTRNVVTVAREGGSSATLSEATGVLGTASVGIYDEARTLSLATDEDALQQAGWRLHIGTHDEARWPVIGVDLAHPTFLTNTTLRNAILTIALGSRVVVTDIPDWLPPYPVDQIVFGYTERISPLHYTIEFNCVPARPYNALYWNSTQRLSGAGTKTPALTSSQTTFTVTLPPLVEWTHKDGDYDIVVNGEQMTVTNVVNGKDFTVIRAVNGVSKSHAVDSLVTLAEPAYLGL